MNFEIVNVFDLGKRQLG